MKFNSLGRLKAWCYHVSREKKPDENRLMFSNDIAKLLVLSEIAKDIAKHYFDDKDELFIAYDKLTKVLEALEEDDAHPQKDS